MTIVTQLVVHLTLDPTRTVTSRQVAALCGVPANNVNKSLAYATMKGWFEVEMQKNPDFPERKRVCVWRAGPRLLKQIENSRPRTLG